MTLYKLTVDGKPSSIIKSNKRIINADDAYFQELALKAINEFDDRDRAKEKFQKWKPSDISHLEK